MTKLRDIFPDLDAMRARAAARPPVTAAEVCARWPETLRDLAAIEAAETWCQICGVDTVPPAAYCPTCDAILACGGVE